MNRGTYLLKRVLLAVPVIWLGTSATFFIIFLGPIDPAAVIAGSTQSRQTHQAYVHARHVLGLDKPLPLQYWHFLTNMYTFHLGQSWILNPGTPAIRLILQYLPRTLWLGIWSVLIAIGIGVPLGFYAGFRANSGSDYLGSLFGIVWRAMPNFWLAVILLAVLSQSQRYLGFDWANLGPHIALTGSPDLTRLNTVSGFLAATKKILPAALVLGSASMGNEMRIGRTAVIETLNEDYVDAARVRGVSRRRLVWKHVFRNALIPLIPVITGEAFLLIGGSVLVETVFGINGVGRLFFNAAINGDLPLVASLMYVFILILVVGNIFQDVVNTLVDPRVGYEGEQ